MNAPRHFVPNRLLFGLGLLLAGASAAFPAPAKWIKLEGPGFVIYSDAPEKQVVDCALRYAGFRRAFDSLFAEPGNPMPPSTLLLFYRDKPFRALLRPEQTGATRKTVNVSLEIDGQSLNVFAVDGDRDNALRMAFIFETMWALRHMGHFAPQWMMQGAGEVMSTLNVRAGKNKIIVGKDNDRSFHENYLWPKFFAISRQSKEYHDPEKLRNYVEQAWGLMHWVLLADGDGLARFDALERGLRTGEALPTVTAVMQTPADDLSRLIRRHTDKVRELPFDAAATKAGFRVAPAADAEVLVLTSEVLAAEQRETEVEVKLTQAAALAPDLPMVKEARARLLLRHGQNREAVDLYREAIAAGSTNFAAYLRSATLRLNDNSSGGQDVAGEGGKEAETAVAELRRAIQLNPGSPEAYQQLGRALFVLPKLTEANIDELSLAAERGADGLNVRHYRALLYSRLGQREPCAKIFRVLLAEPYLAEAAQQQLRREYGWAMEQIDAPRVQQLAEARDYVGAFAVVSAGEADTEPAVAAKYPKLRRWLVETVRRDSKATPEQRKLAGLE